MAKAETINPKGTIGRVADSCIAIVASPKQLFTEITMIGALLSGRQQKIEYDRLYRQYNAGLIKKAELIAYTEVGTRHQRKVARKLLKEDV